MRSGAWRDAHEPCDELMRRRAPAWIAVGVVVGFAGFVYTSYRHDIGNARERVSRASLIAHTPCGPIEYAVAGQGLPLLVVHGAGGGFDQGVDFAAPLTRRGLRVIAMSRFGYLRTPLPADASAAAQADAHACLLDALAIPSTAVVGASAGAPSAMQLALRHPARVSALVLLVPALYVPRPANAPPLTAPPATQFLFDTVLRSDFLFWAAIRLAPGLVIRAILATSPAVVDAAGPDERIRVDAILDRILPVSPRRQGLINDAAVTSTLPRYDLERIAARTLAISVADDLFGTADVARYSAEHIPNARLVLYPSGGHVWVGHQSELINEVAAFVRAP